MRVVLAAALFCAIGMPAHAEIASCYGREHGQTRTATGANYNPWGLTAAHRTLPFGTLVLVTNLRNGRSVTVRINDRGPYVAGRAIDLSLGACRAIGNSGLARVFLQILGASHDGETHRAYRARRTARHGRHGGR